MAELPPEVLPGQRHRWLTRGQSKVLVTANLQAAIPYRAYSAWREDSRHGNAYMNGRWWRGLRPEDAKKAIAAAYPEARLVRYSEDFRAWLEYIPALEGLSGPL